MFVARFNIQRAYSTSCMRERGSATIIDVASQSISHAFTCNDKEFRVQASPDVMEQAGRSTAQHGAAASRSSQLECLGNNSPVMRTFNQASSEISTIFTAAQWY